MAGAQYETEFYSGNHSSLVSVYEDKPKSIKPHHIPYLIASYSFLGKIEDAKNIFKNHSAKLPQSDLVASRFFLGVNLCRNSNYAEGLQHLTANLIERSKHDSRNLYYCYQGMGFYRFLNCRYLSSVNDAQKALNYATDAGFSYGIFLAKDLLGHSLIAAGKIREGLAYLKEAHQLILKFGNGGMARALEFAIACLEAQYGIHPRKNLSTLESLMKKVPPDNNYSRSFLLLEIAKQKLLRGHAFDAECTLDEACKTIYASKHKRLGALLNLSYANLAIQKQEYAQALNLIRNALQDIHPQVDKIIRLKALGLERKIAEVWKNNLQTEDLKEIEEQSVRLTHYSIGKNMLARSRRILPERAKGQDPLGDFIDEIIEKKEKSLIDIKESGFWGLTPYAFSKTLPKECLITHAIPKTLILHSQGNFLFIDRLPQQVEKFLHLISQGTVNKEKMIEEIWQLKYHPLRHDALVYSLVTRTRSFLKTFSGWIMGDERGYYLKPSVALLDLKTATPEEKNSATVTFETSQLNFRQFECLNRLKPESYIDVQAYKKWFKVSQITACRDLTRLVELHLIKKLGKGRATKYCQL